jgi:hypothetical protein
MDLEGWAVELLTPEPADAEADLTLEDALAAVEEAVHHKFLRASLCRNCK